MKSVPSFSQKGETLLSFFGVLPQDRDGLARYKG